MYKTLRQINIYQIIIFLDIVLIYILLYNIDSLNWRNTMKQRKKNKNINIVLIVVTILVSLLLAVSSGYLIYNITLFNGIENFIRNFNINNTIFHILLYQFKDKGKKDKTIYTIIYYGNHECWRIIYI